MARYATVLVATDGSDDGDAAVEAALDLAHDTGARLLVLTVVPEREPSAEGASDDAGAESQPTAGSESIRDDAAVRDANERVNVVVDHALEWGLQAAPLVWEGDPAEAIVAAAGSEAADVIVVGTSGRSGVGRMLLGSVSDHIVRNAAVPVMVVRSQRERE